MKVDVGPVSRDSAAAWLDYATEALAELRRSQDVQVSAHALDGFDALLQEWRKVAAKPGPFRWRAERSAEQVEFLIRALYESGVVIEREHDARGARLRPPDADEFHVVLVDCVLSALEHESPSNAQFVAAMRDQWEIARRR